LINSKEALTFAQRCAHLQIPSTCVIIISRKEPEINAASLFAEGKASIITEDELRFTEDEIAGFIKQQNIVISRNDLSEFIDATKGWALALKLLSFVLKRKPDNINHAFEVMKQNIFNLLEIEAFNDFSGNVKKNLIKLSLVFDLPVTSLREFLDISFIDNTPELSPFIWFDSLIGEHRVHPFYLEFLQSKHGILSDEEKQDAYQWVARWCCKNEMYMAAVKYCAKSYLFDQILEILLSYPFKLPPDTCEYFLNILETLDADNKERGNQSVLLLKNLFIPLLLMGAGRYEEARERSLNIIKDWVHDSTQFSLYLLYTAYSNLAYVDIYTCTATHRYDFAEYLKKAVEYYTACNVPPVKVEGAFAVVDVRSYACLVGENAGLSEVEKFLETARETALYIAETYHNMYYGYDDLVACELAFFRNQTKEAKQFAHEAIKKAREKKQYSIEMMAQFYLLRIAAYEGNYLLTKEILNNLGVYLNNSNIWNSQLLYDLFASFFYIQIGLPDLVSSWLIMDERETASEVHIPIRELIVGVKYHIARQNYDHALVILSNSYPRKPQERFLFGELTLALLNAVAHFKTGDTAGAMADFEKAYELSLCGEFEMPFIELGKNLHLLVTVALRQADCLIPEKWLKLIDCKASIYTKQTAYIVNFFKKEMNIEDNIKLSEREREALITLSRGLTMEEIAVNLYLSVPRIKKILQSVYMKLEANNSAAAIRTAMEKKLIE
jgi:ATP/maltotriose-dependent transcriptional regulator MalT